MITALLLLKQMDRYSKEVGSSLLNRSAFRNAKILEKIFVAALDELDVKSKDLTDVPFGNLHEGITEGFVDADGEGGLFSSFSIKEASSVFADSMPQESRGIITGEDNLKLYSFVSSKQVALGDVDMEKVNLILKTTDTFEDARHMLFDSKSGNIVINSSKEYGFDGAAIGFLGAFEYAGSYSAREMFADIYHNLAGYAEIKNRKGVNYAVSYEPVGDNGLYVLEFVPQKQLTKLSGYSVVILYVFVGVWAVLTIVYTVWIVLVSRKVSKDKATLVRDGKILRMMLMQMAENSLASMFIYHRNTDEMELLRDREVFYPDGKKVKGAIAYLGHYFGHTDEETRRLKNALVLAITKQYTKLELESNSSAGIQIVEYTLCAVNSDDAQTDLEVVCTVVERPKTSTDETTSFSEDKVYNTTGIEVLLETNLWRFMWNNEKCFERLNFGTKFRSNYDEDLEKVISSFIMSKDRHFFMTALSRLNLLENYRNGNTELRVKYRINTGGGVYEYRVLDIHMYRDGKNDEIKANLYARHIG